MDSQFVVKEITQNDPFSVSYDPFKEARAPIKVVEKTNEKAYKNVSKTLMSYDADLERLRQKYIVERKKFEATQLRFMRQRVQLEDDTKMELARLLAKAEKQRLTQEEKKKKIKNPERNYSETGLGTKVEFPAQGVLGLVLDDDDTIEKRKHAQAVSVLARELGGVVHHVPDGDHSMAMSFVDQLHPGQGHLAAATTAPSAETAAADIPLAAVLGGAGSADKHAAKHLETKQASAKAIMLHLRRQGKEDEAAQVEQAFKFSESDPGWADAFFEWLKDRDMLPHNYYMHTHLSMRESFVYPLPNDVRIGIIGDWGTGNKQSRLLIDKMVQNINPQLFIHLGDVYYAGSKQQFQDFYIAPLLSAFKVSSPAELKGRVWTLPGNHDYYAGGGPFYETVDAIGSHSGSYFCLTSDFWSIIGLDTCLNDANPIVTARGVHCTTLPPEQLQWAKQQIDDAKAKGKGVIVLSHHMLFSQHETTGKGKTLSYTNERLYEQFGEAYIQKIDIWFWGHEHAWTKFAPYRGLKRGRLLGNGGVPVLQKENMYAVKPVPGMEPPKPLSKPPATFIIKDSLEDVSDITLWCNGLYQIDLSQSNCSAKYFELHQKGDNWVLEEVVSARDEFAAGK